MSIGASAGAAMTRREGARPKKKCRAGVRGWDWTELLDVLDLGQFRASCEHDQAEMIRLKIEGLIKATMTGLDKPDKAQQRQIAGCRAFLLALGRCGHSYDSGVWAAIGRIKHDWTMLRWLHRELESAWS
jgi:hypothetical protein